MTLDQLLAGDVGADDLRSLWLVFTSGIAQRLKEVQPHYQHQIAPVMLTDGTFAVCADLLTEKDGIYAPTFAALDQSAFPMVQVLSQTAITELLPAPNLEDA